MGSSARSSSAATAACAAACPCKAVSSWAASSRSARRSSDRDGCRSSRAATKLGCFALTEAHGGSDPGRMRTHARRHGGDWAIDGAKLWITNGALADVAIVWATTDDGIKAFLVEKGTSGFESRVIKNKLSLRASSTAELALADVRVPDSARLPDANGLKAALRCLDEARFGIAWGACGAARGCIDTVLQLHAVARAVRPPVEPHAADPNAARERRSPAHGRAATGVAAREAQGARRCDHSAQYRWRSGTTCARRSISRVTAATCWARPA